MTNGQPIFITGTDTNVGKTVISAWLVNQFKMDYWKPIQCGSLDYTDAMQVAELSVCLKTNRAIRIHPEAYKFPQPVSPHLAAKQNGVDISFEYLRFPITQNKLIIEGAGGVWVPINQEQNMMDLMKYLDAKVIIVSRGTLGTINHTCLTVEALRTRNIKIVGVIINGLIDHTNKQAIEQFAKTQVIAELPLFKELNDKTLSTYKTTRLLQKML